MNDVPDLIDIVSKWRDPDWPSDDFGLDADLDDIELLPVTAWRTLADLKSSEFVEPLVNLICEFDEFDDWSQIELPHVFGKIGKPAIAAIVRLANDADKPNFIRSIAAEGLQRVAEYHAETRDEIVTCLTEMITKAAPGDIEFNSTLLVGLVELQAVEAAEAIEQAFANDYLDVGVIGDWQAVRKKLGVEGLGLKMPERPYNSIERLRHHIGIGIFSDRPLVDGDERISEAEQAYYDRAYDLFSKSNEAKQVVDGFGDLGWFRTLLDFGLNYRGEIVDQMTIASVEDFVFDYTVRKVSTEPEKAAWIVFELTKFWEYLDRVFELPDAKSIIQWLKTDGMVESLEEDLSDPQNYDMAKSLVMAGKNAGYDMTSQEGIAEFMAAYNRSLASNRVSKSTASGRQRVGRNDPCPCGSGKKFKKCCL
jgi:hypothetical protein